MSQNSDSKNQKIPALNRTNSWFSCLRKSSNATSNNMLQDSERDKVLQNYQHVLESIKIRGKNFSLINQSDSKPFNFIIEEQLSKTNTKPNCKRTLKFEKIEPNIAKNNVTENNRNLEDDNNKLQITKKRSTTAFKNANQVKMTDEQQNDKKSNYFNRKYSGQEDGQKTDFGPFELQSKTRNSFEIYKKSSIKGNKLQLSTKMGNYSKDRQISSASSKTIKDNLELTLKNTFNTKTILKNKKKNVSEVYSNDSYDSDSKLSFMKKIKGFINQVLPKFGDGEENEDMCWCKYHNLTTINNFMRKMQRDFPKLVKIKTIGTTCENRKIKVLRISDTSYYKDTIVIEAGIHAREWITPATATFIIHFLLTRWYILPTHLKNKTWIFFPIVNPDGYYYTWKTERLWRKNRRQMSNSNCYGIDLNRNFSVGWEQNVHDDPCHLNYKGPKPFSEKESQAIRDFLTPLKSYLKAYIALHSFGQEIRFHWGLNEEIPNLDRVEQIAKIGAKKMSKIHKQYYETGTTKNKPIFGNSRDWARKIFGIQYSYVVELRDNGYYGFLLPENEIIPTAEEGLEFIATVAMAIDEDKQLTGMVTENESKTSIDIKRQLSGKVNTKR